MTGGCKGAWKLLIDYLYDTEYILFPFKNRRTIRDSNDKYKKNKKDKKLDKLEIQNYKEEYRFITDHIFEEGKQQLDRNKYFLGFNLALFTAFGFFAKEIISTTEFIGCDDPADCVEVVSYGDFQYLLLLLPVVGFFISLFSVKIIRKVEGHIQSRVKRAKEIEEEVATNKGFWAEGKLPPAKPRCYWNKKLNKFKECEWCGFKDRCIKEEKDK